MKQYEDEVTYKLLSDEDIANGYFAKFNAAVILRADFKTQLEAMATAVQNAIYTPNEARAYLDKGERPGGDQLICNGSMLPLTQAGIQYAKGGEKMKLTNAPLSRASILTMTKWRKSTPAR